MPISIPFRSQIPSAGQREHLLFKRQPTYLYRCQRKYNNVGLRCPRLSVTATDAAGRFYPILPGLHGSGGHEIDPRGNSTTYTYDFLGNLKSVTDVVTNTATSMATTTMESDVGNGCVGSSDSLRSRCSQSTQDKLPIQTCNDDATIHLRFSVQQLMETDQSGRVTLYTYDLGAS